MSSINKPGSAEVKAIQETIRNMEREKSATPFSKTTTKVTKLIEKDKLGTVSPLEKDLAETWELFNKSAKRQESTDSTTSQTAIDKLKILRKIYQEYHPGTELHYMSSEGRIVLVPKGNK